MESTENTMILDILDEVGRDNSRLHKEKVLIDNADNELLKEVFRLTYDKTLFYTRHIPDISTWGSVSETYDLKSALDDFKKNLCTRKMTGNAAITQVNHVFRNTSIKDCEVLKRVLLGDLRVGATRSTANKAWPGLIKKPEFMLCSSTYEEDAIGMPAFSQTKEDGARCRLEWDGETVTLTSRNDSNIEHLGTFNEWAKENLNIGDPSLDGELVCFKDGKRLDRKTSNGIVNKAIKNTISKEEAEMLVFVCWDLEDKTRAYHERLDAIENFEGKVRAIESRVVNSYEEALNHFVEAREAGLEGTILKRMDSFWEGKRVKFQAKFKAEYEAEFEFDGIEEGSGKNVGKVGALRYKSRDGLIKGRVGIFKDFPDDIRETWWTNPPKIFTIRYNERIKAKGSDIFNLFLPRVIFERLDKTEADTLEEIIEIEKSILEIMKAKISVSKFLTNKTVD